MTTLVVEFHQSQHCHSHRSYSRDEKRVADRETRGYRPITVRDTNVRDTRLPPGWSNCIMEKQTCLILQRIRGLIKLQSHEKCWREFVCIFPTESSIIFTFAARIKQNRLPSDGDRNDFEVWWLHLGARGVESAVPRTFLRRKATGRWLLLIIVVVVDWAPHR